MCVKLRRPGWLTSILLAALALTSLAGGRAAAADGVRPRFVVLFDTSGSMIETANGVQTHGDGSQTHPGCDLDGNGKYDDSKLFQAKAALNDTIAAFGTAEFALARYHQDEHGETCPDPSLGSSCARFGKGANFCEAGRCGFRVPSGSPDYDECDSPARGCQRCAAPATDPVSVFYSGSSCCPAGAPTSGGFGMSGDVVVPFPAAGGSNVPDLFMWMDGKEDFPANKELRASGTTPIGGALNAVRDWLVNDGSPVGPAGGALNRDAQTTCRAYNVILITDGLEVAACVNNCKIDAARAAELLYHSCTNGGIWDPFERRCERGGSPEGTSEVRVRTWVVGYNVNDPQLNTIAAAGGTGSALVANNQAELTARLGDIIAASIPTERCDCQDNTCDGQVDETFTSKGKSCTVGVGRCKRQGVSGCKADGTGLVCSADAAGICPATELAPGAPVAEVCGIAPGCDAPNPEDCADDDCDGLVDENMSCACASKPEICNGQDDDCNGAVDDVPQVKCGLEIGECRPGLSACVADGAGGKATVCVGATQPVPELCDGRDNDCDGITDNFGLGCYPGGTAGCTLTTEPLACGAAPVERWSCQGACQPGLVTCTDGRCGACTGASTPTPEAPCDNVDNDCDGEVDEGFGVGGACGPGASGVGECRAGLLQCVQGAPRCMGGQGPIEELCNGKDDNCDGEVDNVTGVCGPARGECRAGRWRCEGEALVCDQPQGPRPELCDGKDNDCDGQIDEDPLDPELVTTTACGTQVGLCRPGVLRCLGGGKICAGGVEPERELCNGEDDDCDGESDEGLNAPGPCPPPGLPPGAPVVGECRPGANVCAPSTAGASWTCAGGVGPAAELCDGKDNDCDGQVDDGATCAAGEGCADGECVPRCRPTDETSCPAGRSCMDGLCRFAECVRKACPRGQVCDPARGCVDPCEGVSCPAGTLCERGVCTSCHLTGCAAGQVCRVAACEPDPCAGKSCARGSYCRAGACVKSCRDVKCGAGTSCRDGACVRDLCAGVSCEGGQFCDPTNGRCRPDPCAAIACLPGQACVPAQAACVPDPCLVTRCAAGDVCELRADGEAVCVDGRGRATRTRVAPGGAGCGCDVGAGERPHERGLLGPGALALLGLGLFRRRRRAGGRR